MKRHFFTTCGECGGERPNYSGICADCDPMYRDSDGSRDGQDPQGLGAQHDSAGHPGLCGCGLTQLRRALVIPTLPKASDTEGEG
ncbi:hypothetical protein [Sphingobium sp. DC-2]|uniref:hypothetical protein n=1 Tax=Sphingobium sp. DC-2 TaxID=1303256 RepID=UPI0012DD489D|nr:hypothetical protein [Sphingobium sp. DC-2]